MMSIRLFFKNVSVSLIAALPVFLIIFSINVNVLLADGPEYKYSGNSLRHEVQKQLSEKRYKSIDYVQLFNILGIKPGMTILDVGAGLGFFTYQFSKEVGSTGRAFATDVSQDAIN